MQVISLQVPYVGAIGNKFNGEIAWVRIDIGTDSQDHLIRVDDRLNIAVGTAIRSSAPRSGAAGPGDPREEPLDALHRLPTRSLRVVGAGDEHTGLVER